MTLALIGLGLLFLVLPGAMSSAPSGLTVAQWARSCRNSLALGLALVVTGLVLWGAPAVLHVADGSGLTGFCDDAVHALPLGGVYLAAAVLIVAAVVAARLAGAVALAIRGLRNARVDAFIGNHRQVAEFDVVIVPSTRLLAVAVSGDAPQIVLSEGLVSNLDDAEVHAVIRHEMAHHRLRHRHYLVIAAAVDRVLGWIPAVRASTRALRDAIEHWADEVSTAGSRDRVAGLRSALARIGAIDGTTPTKRAIQRRLDRLGRRRSTAPSGLARSRLVYSAIAMTGLAAMLGLSVASAVQLIAVLGRCPA